MEDTLIFLRDTLIVGLIIIAIIFSYRKLLRYLNKGNSNKQYALLHHFDEPVQHGDVQIRYTLPEDSTVTMLLNTMTGETVKTLKENVEEPAGEHVESVSSSELENGAYLCVLITQNQRTTLRMVVENEL